MLVLDVSPERVLKPASYHTGRTHPWEVSRLAAVADDILFPQANIRVKVRIMGARSSRRPWSSCPPPERPMKSFDANWNDRSQSEPVR
jgi:hypothetical protein